jgi:ABC-type transport system substrate-binding protein
VKHGEAIVVHLARSKAPAPSGAPSGGSWEVAARANKWQGRNVTRFRSEDYDRAFKAADSELDPVKRAALFIKMNDIVIQNVVVIPVLWRNGCPPPAPPCGAWI